MPVVIERCPGERDLVCGGFLGWDALAALKRLGLDPAALGARPIHRLRLVSGRRTVEAALPRPRPACRAGGSTRPCSTWRRRRARRCCAGGRRARSTGACLRLDDGEEMAADALFLATGKHELRGAVRADRWPAGVGGPARRAAADARPRRNDRAASVRRRLCRPAHSGGWRDQSLPHRHPGADGRQGATLIAALIAESPLARRAARDRHRPIAGRRCRACPMAGGRVRPRPAVTGSATRRR